MIYDKTHVILHAFQRLFEGRFLVLGRLEKGS